MKLSVVVLTYNQEDTIRQTLDSILSQEHPYSMEIIVADDASSDKTPEIIAEYATRYPNIIKPILRDKNLGLIGNYFDAISHCSGEYIAGCAGDDYWLPDKIITQISFMDSHAECVLTYGNAIVENQSSHKAADIIIGMEDNSFSEFMNGNHIAAVTLCFKRTIMDRYVNIIKPTSRSWIMEDFPFILWISLHYSIHWINKELAVYRIKEESLSHSHHSDRQLIFEQNDFSIREFFLSKWMETNPPDKAYYNLYCAQRIAILNGNRCIKALDINVKQLYRSTISFKLKTKTLILNKCPIIYKTLNLIKYGHDKNLKTSNLGV